MAGGQPKSLRPSIFFMSGTKTMTDPNDKRRRNKMHIIATNPTQRMLLLFLGTAMYVSYCVVTSRALFLHDGSSFQSDVWLSVANGLWASPNSAPESHVWSTRLAVTRATQDMPYTGTPLASHATDDKRPALQASATDRRYAAVLLQVGSSDLWDDMLMCAANVAAAVPDGFAVDVYVSFVGDKKRTDASLPSSATAEAAGGNQHDLVEGKVRASLNQLARVDQIYINWFESSGSDISQFLEQLKFMTKISESRLDGGYEVILKQHTKRDAIWRQRNVESLCGTPEQVKSIWNKFRDDPNVGIVVPFGTAFGSATPSSHIFPHIRRNYKWLDPNSSGRQTTFDKKTIKHMRELQKTIYGQNSIPFEDDQLMVIAGSAFWIRRDALQPGALVKWFGQYHEKLSKRSTDILGMEHALERLIPTVAISRGMTIGDILPAPRVVALYDTKYTSEIEGGTSGEGLDQWSLLKPIEMDGVRKPLSVEKGGFGYYDLMNVDVRKRQGDLARRAGLSGFVFYHYWFSGSNAPEEHKAMFKVQEQMLKDGEPNIPFLLSWVNEPWSTHQSGEEKEMTLSQDYGDAMEWEQHFLYLLQFFRHHNYIRNHSGQPIFILYRAGHVGPKLKPMVALWRKLATQHGLPGLEIISTVGNFYASDEGTNDLVADANLDGSFHFWPQLMGAGFMDASETSSTSNILAEKIGVSRQYWGAFSGFNLKPRNADAVPILRSVQQFRQGLDMSFRAMAQPNFDTDLNLFFITAWNHWNEQAMLEPDETNKFGYLDAIPNSLQHIPVLPRRTQPLLIYHAGPALTGAAGIQCEAQRHLDKLLDDGIHYLGGKGPDECSNDGHTLTFDIRDVSQCSLGISDCQERLASFSKHVEALRSQRLTALVSEPVHTEELKHFLSSLRKGWHIRVLLSYRRYHEWLPDLYSQLFSMESDLYKQWPRSVGDDGLFIPSFPDFYRRMHPTATQELGGKPHPDFLDFLENFRKEYDEVRIFNMHEVIATSKGLNGDFFCQTLPEAPHLCEAFATVIPDGTLETTISETRSPFLHDRLAVGAFFRGWVDKSLSREEVRNAVKKRLSGSAEKFPLSCISSAEAKAFLSHSEKTEMTLVPAFFASDMGQAALHSDFFSRLHKNKFCSEDVERILDNIMHWKPFFRSLHSTRPLQSKVSTNAITTEKDSTSGLHVVISHCDEPMNWIWKRLLIDVKWKSMTIFSKCGKSIKSAELPPNANVVALPNVGRNDHSYAYWIADVFEAPEKSGLGQSAKVSQTLPHDFVKLNSNDYVMFVNDGESHSEQSSETKLPWNEIMDETKRKGFGCGTRVNIEGAQALNIVSKKNIGLFKMDEQARRQIGFKSSFRNLEDWVGNLPIDLALGNQALNAREMKLTNREIGGSTPLAEAGSIDAIEEIDLFMPVCYGGLFVASAQRIEESRVGNWGAIVKSLARGDNIEETHFMERIWAGLLSRPFSRKEQEDLMRKDFDIIRRRGHRYKGLVTLPKSSN